MRSMRLCLGVFLAAAACWQPRPGTLVDVAIKGLQSEDEAERAEAFQEILQAGYIAVPRAKAALAAGARWGFPLVAVLYAQGEGDAVPMELRARHLAGFRWPPSRAVENAILEPYVWNEVERDVVQAGRPALKSLARALERDAPTEAKALQVVRAMLLIGGRAAAEQFAGLLDSGRDLGGARVCDVAAAALLYCGYQEIVLRTPGGGDALVGAAREWWNAAKDARESEWIRSAAVSLAERWRPGDPEGVRPVFEMLVGREVDDPKAWLEGNPGWSPAPPPVHLEELLPALSAGRARAFDANRRLETAAGVRLQAPRISDVGGLRAALRLWRPEPGLEARWRRYLGGAYLRLWAAVIAHVPQKGANHVAALLERQYHAGEDEMVSTASSDGRVNYLLYLQSRDFGTKLAFGEHVAAGGMGWAEVWERPALGPRVSFCPPMKSCTVAVIEEIPGPQAPRSAEAVFAEVRARLREAALAARDGSERRMFLRALGYCQDRGDLEFLRSQEAWGPLLMLGDPESISHDPRLEPHEIEMALRRAEDQRVRVYLEGVRSGSRR